jgi:hypothetical protein
MAAQSNSFDTTILLDPKYGAIEDMMVQCKKATLFLNLASVMFTPLAKEDGVEAFRASFENLAHPKPFHEDVAKAVATACKGHVLAPARGRFPYTWDWGNGELKIRSFRSGPTEPQIGIGLAQLFAQLCGLHGVWLATWSGTINRDFDTRTTIGTAVYTRTKVYDLNVQEWQKMKTAAIEKRLERNLARNLRRLDVRAGEPPARTQAMDQGTDGAAGGL